MSNQFYLNLAKDKLSTILTHCKQQPYDCFEKVRDGIKTAEEVIESLNKIRGVANVAFSTTHQYNTNHGHGYPEIEITITDTSSVKTVMIGTTLGVIVGAGAVVAFAPLVPLAGAWGLWAALGYTTINTAGICLGGALGAAGGAASGILVGNLPNNLTCTEEWATACKNFEKGQLDLHCDYGDTHLDLHFTFQAPEI